MSTSFYFGDNLFLYHIEEVSLSCGHKEVKKKKKKASFLIRHPKQSKFLWIINENFPVIKIKILMHPSSVSLFLEAYVQITQGSPVSLWDHFHPFHAFLKNRFNWLMIAYSICLISIIHQHELGISIHMPFPLELLSHPSRLLQSIRFRWSSLSHAANFQWLSM